MVPLEVVGSTIAEIRNTSSSVVHVTHSEPVPWRFIIGRVAQAIGLPVVPYHDWQTRLLEILPTTCQDEEATAIAMFGTQNVVDTPTTEIMARMSNENALREPPALGTAQPPVDKDADSQVS